MKAVVAAFNQEKALVGAFSVITNLRIKLFEALVVTEPELRKYPSHHHGAAIIQYGNFESFVKDIRLMMDYNLSKFLNKINFTGVLQIKRSCFFINQVDHLDIEMTLDIFL